MDAVLNEKSKQNLLAADLLIKNSLHNPSVHCSYYALVQYMLHIIFNKLGKEKQSFDTEKRLNREGSHSYAEKLISIELAKKSHSDFKWYQKNFPELKKMREDADYTEIATTSDKCRDALRRSETLISTLRNNFK